jgi:glycosyltransferase involved in cell wall biosynthesis
MRIALTVDPELPVPPLHYGGIERVVHLLAREYTRLGHEVTLFANPHSSCPVSLMGWPGATSRSHLDTVRNMAELTRQVLGGNYDVVHSCSRLAYLLPIMPLPIPKMMNYHRLPNPRAATAMHCISRGTLEFSAVGHWMTKQPGLPGTWHAVPNCVPIDSYTPQFNVDSGAPLVFLGRLEEIKGPHLAIDIAKRAGRRLVLAGNVERQHQGWFDEHVRPQIDGERIRYIGPVNDSQKNELLGLAHAFLMPILWDEPYGLVMAEAMACGTPVIALRRGAAAEVVVTGRTGFVVDTIDEMIRCVDRVNEISRKACRERVEETYSETAVARQYLTIFEHLIARVRGDSPQGRPKA